MKKKLFIFFLFTLSATLLYWLTISVTKVEIEESMSSDNGVIINGLVAVFMATVGMTTYFMTVNSAAVIGLLISLKRNDSNAISAFKYLIVLSLLSTFLFYLYSH